MAPGVPLTTCTQDQGWDAWCSSHHLASPLSPRTLVQSAHLGQPTPGRSVPLYKFGLSRLNSAILRTQASWELEILLWLAEEERKLSEVT